MEKEKIFSSKTKYVGVLKFSEFYKFCYNWLMEETGMDFIIEKKYTEKLKGDSKDIEIKWEGYKKITDYFRIQIKVHFIILGLKNIEINQNGKKIKTNEGSVKMKVTGTLMRDWQGKFERDAFRKFLRGIYEKWVITSRIDQMEEKLTEYCQEYLNQVKAWLDLEGKM